MLGTALCSVESFSFTAWHQQLGTAWHHFVPPGVSRFIPPGAVQVKPSGVAESVCNMECKLLHTYDATDKCGELH